MNVGEAIVRLKSSLGTPGGDPDYEGLCAGRAEIMVRGVAACFAPSLEALNAAVAKGANLIVADGHPFYLYDPLRNGAPPPQALIDDAPPVIAKRALIAKHDLAIVRLRTAWNFARPSVGPGALAASLGLKPVATDPTNDHVVCALPSRTAARLVADIAARPGFTGLRLIGDGRSRVSRIAVSNGLVTPAKLRRMLADPKVDAVVCGEVVEWEVGPYLQDVIATGRPMAMILTGFAASQEPIVEEVARWAGEALAMPVTSLHSAPSIWAPAGRVA